MNNMKTTICPPRSIQDAQSFFERNGNSLSEILHAIGGNPALDMFCDAKQLLEQLNPNMAEVETAFRKMKETLQGACLNSSQLDPSLRWHGARISELATRLG